MDEQISGHGQVAGGGRRREKYEVDEIRHLDRAHEAGCTAATNRAELMMRN